jgi:hypothetical protein
MKLAYELLGDIQDAFVADDKAYDAGPLVQMLQDNHRTVVIPSKIDRAGQRTIDRHLYKERCLVECFYTLPRPWCGWFEDGPSQETLGCLLDGDLEAEVFESAHKALGQLGMLAAVEVRGPEVLVLAAGGEHVEG